MKIELVSIANRSKSVGFDAFAKLYLDRLAPYVKIESSLLRTEQAFFEWLDRHRARTSPVLLLLDSRGRQFTSEQFADWLRKQQDCGTQSLVIAIGPADGWTDEARGRADTLLSLSAMTLPHEMVRVVLAEQIYRAFTILAGHPYHCGH